MQIGKNEKIDKYANREKVHKWIKHIIRAEQMIKGVANKNY